MDTRTEKTINELTGYWTAINREMAQAPAWKIGTTWWTDRERELDATARRLEMLGVTTW